MALKKQVMIHVDKDFFEKIFEPPRRKMEEKLGVRISQTKFTRMIFKNNMDLTPKLNFDFKTDIKLRSLKIKGLDNLNGIKRNKRKI